MVLLHYQILWFRRLVLNGCVNEAPQTVPFDCAAFFADDSGQAAVSKSVLCCFNRCLETKKRLFASIPLPDAKRHMRHSICRSGRLSHNVYRLYTYRLFLETVPTPFPMLCEVGTNHIPNIPAPPPCLPAASPCIFSLTLMLTSKNFATHRSMHTDSPLFRSPSR